MEKKEIRKTVLYLTGDSPITWETIKHFNFQDGDEISAGFDEDQANESYYYLCVERMVMETDEEFENRLSIEENQRYERYAMQCGSFVSLAKKLDPNYKIPEHILEVAEDDPLKDRRSKS